MAQTLRDMTTPRFAARDHADRGARAPSQSRPDRARRVQPSGFPGKVPVMSLLDLARVTSEVIRSGPPAGPERPGKPIHLPRGGTRGVFQHAPEHANSAQSGRETPAILASFQAPKAFTEPSESRPARARRVCHDGPRTVVASRVARLVPGLDPRQPIVRPVRVHVQRRDRRGHGAHRHPPRFATSAGVGSVLSAYSTRCAPPSRSWFACAPWRALSMPASTAYEPIHTW